MHGAQMGLNCDINNHKHGFVAEDDVTVQLFFQKSKSAGTPEIFLTEVKRHLPSDVKAGLARTDERDGKPGYRLVRLRYARWPRLRSDERILYESSGCHSPATVPIR